ncbi:DDE superfamily endonuclease [Phytophthora infestans]|uniref:DDE superfamily endonuclease n=1 Tax=Phytophthora infestans TaxID=4787 RepID=A0A8S9V9P7_PHYIN|nr:DDE superfamily endonuclease [Phytophthora infestans]KAF4149768.1 DDE superfamily endonuclease [Phytophthora infestans]
MAFVDAHQRFMAFSVRPESCNDQSVWKRSLMGTYVKQRLPFGMHFTGDAGYALRSYMLTPFAHSQRDNPVINKFNKAHSRTRIPVEMAFGTLKGRFQILRRELDMNSDVEDGKVIASCFVLHNFSLTYERNTLEELATVIRGDYNNSMHDEMLLHNENSGGDLEVFQVEEDAEEELLEGQRKRNNIVSELVESVSV